MKKREKTPGNEKPTEKLGFGVGSTKSGQKESADPVKFFSEVILDEAASLRLLGFFIDRLDQDR